MRRLLFHGVVILAVIYAGSVSLKVAEGRKLSMRASVATSSMSSAKGISSSRAAVVPVPAVPKAFAIPILVYHHIRLASPYPKSTWSWKMSVSPEVFKKQMQWLDDHDYTTVTLDTFVKIKNGEILGPVKPVVITFDDNNENAYEQAFAVLKQHFFIATWYVITNRFDKPTFLTTAQIKEMAAAGMDIQSHSVTHSWMTNLPVSRQKWELDESRKAIETLTGKPVRHLAYPLTMRNAQVINSVREEWYATATIMDPRPATQKDDLLTLPRIMMTDDTDLKRWLP